MRDPDDGLGLLLDVHRAAVDAVRLRDIDHPPLSAAIEAVEAFEDRHWTAKADAVKAETQSAPPGVCQCAYAQHHDHPRGSAQGCEFDDHAQLLARATKAEADAAAMRGALALNAHSQCVERKYSKCMAQDTSPAIRCDAARKALAPDAGKRLFDAARMAEKALDSVLSTNGPAHLYECPMYLGKLGGACKCGVTESRIATTAALAALREVLNG